MVITFVKNAELGHVKTRLASTVGERNALKIYMELVRHTRSQLLEVDAARAIYYSSYIDEYDFFTEEDFVKRLQMGEDLGERMKNAFQGAFNKGFQKVVIIGSDCWELHSNLIDQAFTALETNDHVLGPAEDGGYYLLGMRSYFPAVFENKEWSTANVLVDSILEIEKAKRSYVLLPVLSDVDYESDLPKELRALLEND